MVSMPNADRMKETARSLLKSMSSAVIVSSCCTSSAESGCTLPVGSTRRGWSAPASTRSSAAEMIRPAMPEPRPVASEEHDEDSMATAMLPP